MTPDIKGVLRLQSLDIQAAELQKEVESLPRHIAEIEKALEAHNRRLEADRAAGVANQRERKSLEDDIKVQDQKISKLRDQMLLAKTNEQYRAFQNEITFCEQEIRKFEDRILELMGASEPLEVNVKAAEEALKKERQQVEQEKEEARRRTEIDRDQLKRVSEERQAAIASMDPQLYREYERIRKRYRGVVVADATDGRCTACQMSLRPQFYQELRTGAKLQLCESCGRILYYNPPVSLEHELHQKV